MADPVADAVEAVAAPIVSAHGADLEDVATRRAGRRLVVVVTVDADGGIELDAIADISGEISRALDERGTLGDQSYTLEVTSPGVGRPLTLPRHWRRNVGRLVSVTTADGKSLEGRLVAADEDSATVAVADRAIRLVWPDVQRAVVQVEFPKEGR